MKLKFFLPAITWFVISVVLLTLPGNDLPQSKFFEIPFFDKYVHFTMFFLLTTLFCFPFFYAQIDNSVIKGWFNKIAIYVILYGALMEFVQKYFVPGRSFDLVDIVFDAIGSLAGLLFIRQIYLKKNRPQ